MVGNDDSNSAAESLSIGELSVRVGCPIETIRYYERAGVLRAPPRTAGGRRVYTDVHVQHLSFVRRARDLGFSLERTRELLRLFEREPLPCADVITVATAHLTEVRQRIAELQRSVDRLGELIGGCPGEGTAAACPILAWLANPGSGANQGAP